MHDVRMRLVGDMDGGPSVRGFTIAMERLRRSGIDPRGNEVIEACLDGQTGIVETLLKGGAWVDHPDEDGNTPLILAALDGNVELVRLLLQRGANVDARNHYGLTALMEAAFWGNLDVITILLRHGAEVNASDRLGRTALCWAASEGRYDIVCLLEDMIGEDAADPSVA
ncbi:MAG: ankyrin repeat domain-containing protein [Pseudomonadota bacterium]